MKALKLTGNTPAVRNRQRTEQTIVLTAAEALLAAGYQLGVNDGEEVTVTHCNDINAVQDALFTTDEDYLYIFAAGRNADEKDKRPDGWVRCIYGESGWDVICDYSPADVLDKIIGEGTKTQALSDYAADNNTTHGFTFKQ